MPRKRFVRGISFLGLLCPPPQDRISPLVHNHFCVHQPSESGGSVPIHS